MSPPLIFLATPCFGGQVGAHYLNSVLGLQGACAERGVGLHVELLENDTQITRARARLCARFMACPDATHLLFVDADIGFAPQAALRLLDASHEVAGGVYPLKAVDWTKVRAAAAAGAADLMGKSVGYVIRFIPTPDNSVQVEGGFANVAYVGTGFMMITRAAVERLAAAHPELAADLGELEPGAASIPMLFDTLIEPQTGQHLSEDYAFCHRWRALGGEIWADVETRLTHVGPTAYSGSLMEAMRPG